MYLDTWRNQTYLNDHQLYAMFTFTGSHVFGAMLLVFAPVSKFTHHVLLTLITSAWFPLRTRQTRDRGCDVPLIHPACAQGSLCLGNLHKMVGSSVFSKQTTASSNISTAVRCQRFCADAKSCSCDANLALHFISQLSHAVRSVPYPQPTPQIPHLLLFDITL